MSDFTFIQGRDGLAILQAAAALGENVTVRDLGDHGILDIDEALRQGASRPGSIEVQIHPATTARLLAAIWRLRRA